MPDDRMVGRKRIDDLLSRLPDKQRLAAKAFVGDVIGGRSQIPQSIEHEIGMAIMKYEQGGDNIELSGESKGKIDAAMASLPPEAPAGAPAEGGSSGGTLDDMAGESPLGRIERPGTVGIVQMTPMEAAALYTGIEGMDDILTFERFQDFVGRVKEVHGSGAEKEMVPRQVYANMWAVLNDVKGGKSFAEAVAGHMPEMAGYAGPAAEPPGAGTPEGGAPPAPAGRPPAAPPNPADAAGMRRSGTEGGVPVWEATDESPEDVAAFLASLGADADAGGAPPGDNTSSPDRKTPVMTPAVGGGASAAPGRGSTELAGAEDLESIVAAPPAGGTPPGPAPSGADDAAGAPPAEPAAVKYDLSDSTFDELMQEVALVPGISPLDEHLRKERERICRYLFNAFKKVGRPGITEEERGEFAQYALEIAGGAAPNVTVQKYKLLAKVAFDAGIMKKDASPHEGGHVEGMLSTDELVAKVRDRIRAEHPEVAEAWINNQIMIRVLPYLSTAAAGPASGLYLDHAADIVESRVREMVANGEHLLASAAPAGAVEVGAAPGGAALPMPSPGDGGEPAASAPVESRTPMKLEEALERARTSYFMKIDSVKFVDYHYLKRGKKWFGARLAGGIAAGVAKLIGKEKKDEKKPEEKKKRITGMDAQPLSIDYVSDVVKRYNVPTNASGSDVYVTLEEVMAAFEQELKNIGEYHTSDAHRNEKSKNDKDQRNYEILTLVEIPREPTQILNLIYATAELSGGAGRGWKNERRTVEGVFNQLKDRLDYDTIILLLKYAIAVKGGSSTPCDELAEKLKAARMARGEEEHEPEKRGRRKKGEKKEKDEAEEKPPAKTYKLPAERIPEGCVATIDALFSALALKYVGADGNPETPANMRNWFELYSVIPIAMPVFNNDASLAGLAFRIDENYQRYNQTVIDKNPDGTLDMFPTPPGSERIIKIETLVEEIAKDQRTGIKTESQRKFLNDLVMMYAQAVSDANLNFTDPNSKRDWIVVCKAENPAFAREILRNALVDAYLLATGAAEEASAESAAAAGGAAPPPEEPKGRRLVRIRREEINEAGYNILPDPVGDAEGRQQIEGIVGNAFEAGELPNFMPVEGSDNIYEVDEGSKTKELNAVAAICRSRYSGKKKTQAMRAAAEPVEVPSEFRRRIPIGELEAVTNRHFGHYTGAIPVDEARKLAEDSEAVVVEGGEPHVDGEKFYRAACGVSKWVNKPKEMERVRSEMGEALKKAEEANEALGKFISDPDDPVTHMVLQRWERYALSAYTAVDAHAPNNNLNPNNPVDVMRAESNRKYRAIVDDPEKRTVDRVLAYVGRNQDEMNFLEREYLDTHRRYDEMEKNMKEEIDRYRDRWHAAQADVGALSRKVEELSKMVEAFLAVEGGRVTRRRAPAPSAAPEKKGGWGFFGKAAAAAVLIGAGYAAWKYGKPHVGPVVESHIAAREARAAETVNLLTDIKAESQRISGSYTTEGTAFQEGYDAAVNR